MTANQKVVPQPTVGDIVPPFLSPPQDYSFHYRYGSNYRFVRLNARSSKTSSSLDLSKNKKAKTRKLSELSKTDLNLLTKQKF